MLFEDWIGSKAKRVLATEKLDEVDRFCYSGVCISPGVCISGGAYKRPHWHLFIKYLLTRHYARLISLNVGGPSLLFPFEDLSFLLL